MTQLTALLLEDDPATLAQVATSLGELGLEVRSEQDPTKWMDRVKAGSFHIVVTDLMDGDEGEPRPGDEIVEEIFKHNFVPIVVHSAFAGLSGHFPGYTGHPFLRVEAKAGESVAAVSKHVAGYMPLAAALVGVREEVQRAFDTTLTQTARAIESVADVASVLPYLIRRRIAATFDRPSGEASGLKPVERYLVPPIASYLRTGDILHLRSDSDCRTEHCRLVLSQTCDLVWNAKRSPKIERVLLAAPASPDQVDAAMGVPAKEPEVGAATALENPGAAGKGALVAIPATAAEQAKRIPQLSKVRAGKLTSEDSELRGVLKQLCDGTHASGLVALPGIPGRIDSAIVFDLKHLDLLELSDIEAGCANSAADCMWERIASQDSPFREQITWNLITLLGRPALPDVDQASVIDDLVKHLMP